MYLLSAYYVVDSQLSLEDFVLFILSSGMHKSWHPSDSTSAMNHNHHPSSEYLLAFTAESFLGFKFTW